jgi:transposase InsO family protein
MLSGAFTSSELNYPIVEKECYAINKAVDTLGYLLERPEGFRLFTDHANLVFMLDPLSSGNKVRKNSVDKIHRWAANLFPLKFQIHHIAGEDNVFADLLTRWGAGDSFDVIDYTLNYISASYTLLNIHANDVDLHAAAAVVHASAPLRPSYVSFHNISYSHIDDNYEQPSPSEILRIQQQFAATDTFRQNPTYADDFVVLDDPSSQFHGVTYFANKIWLPRLAVDLQVRFCILAHCGPAYHKDYNTTYKFLSDVVFWESREADFKKFYRSCLPCASVNGSKEILRPFGETIPATSPNSVLEFDFLHVNKLPVSGTTHLYEYILVLKDKFSKFVWLHPCVTANAQAVVNALLQWHSLFGVAPTWISDRGSHFMNEVMTELNRQSGSKHHFTLAYTPWSNGSVERVNRDILSMLRKALQELNCPFDQWVYLLPGLNKAINETPSRTLKLHDGTLLSPRKVFLNLDSLSPVAAAMYRPAHHMRDQLTALDFSSRSWQVQLQELQKSISEMHEHIALTTSQIASLRKNRRTRQHSVIIANFTPGQFVLRANVRTAAPGNKLSARWEGPYRVLRAINSSVYVIQDLLDDSLHEVHTCRLKPYWEADLRVTVELLDQVSTSRGNISYDSISSYRFNRELSSWEFHIKWLGFSDAENTWESAATVFAVNRQMTRAFINRVANAEDQAALKVAFPPV